MTFAFQMLMKQNIPFDMLRAQVHTITHTTLFVEKIHVLLPHWSNPTPSYWFPVRGCCVCAVCVCKRERFFPALMKWHTTMKAAGKPVGMTHNINSVLISLGLRNLLGLVEIR